MMRSLSPSCFTPPEPAEDPQIAASKCDASQNLVTCIYQLQQQNDDEASPSSFLTLTWSNTRLGHSLTVHLGGTACTIDISSPSAFSLFRSNRRRGSQAIGPDAKLFWSFAGAQFNNQGPEPSSNFYLCLVAGGRLRFLVGDLLDDAIRHARLGNCDLSGFQRCDLLRRSKNGIAKQASVSQNNLLLNLMSRREHVFGRHNYTTVARFGGSGREHEIGIKCKGGEKGKEASLVVKVDGVSVLVVKRLSWKFRGNQRVVVDGSTVEIFWDVYNWLFNGGGHAVFIFQAGGGGGFAVGGVWPELVMKGPEKKLLRKSVSSSTESACSVLQWADGDSGNRSSDNSGFSLLLYAWRREK